MTVDSITRLFEEAFSDPGNWVVLNPQPGPTPAIESYATASLIVTTSSRRRSLRQRSWARR
jgi:hypothetical protein